MAAISAVAATISIRATLPTDKYKQVSATITFGDGVATYPTGGIPVSASTLGFRSFIRDIMFSDMAAADGFIYKFDSTNSKIKIFQANYPAVAAGALTELPALTVVAATNLVVQAEGV